MATNTFCAMTTTDQQVADAEMQRLAAEGRVASVVSSADVPLTPPPPVTEYYVMVEYEEPAAPEGGAE